MTITEYWEQARKDSREAMGNLIKQTVDDNLDDMVRAKAYVKNHNEGAIECAKADLYFASYVQAYHETKGHKAVAMDNSLHAAATPARMA